MRRQVPIELSFEAFAAALAALGASTAVGCASAPPPPPVHATEVTTGAPQQGGHASCSAKGRPARATATEVAAPAPAASTTKPTTDPKVAPAGEASCGAGGCGGETKKNIL